jgi:hypothetical protein
MGTDSQLGNRTGNKEQHMNAINSYIDNILAKQLAEALLAENLITGDVHIIQELIYPAEKSLFGDVMDHYSNTTNDPERKRILAELQAILFRPPSLKNEHLAILWRELHEMAYTHSVTVNGYETHLRHVIMKTAAHRFGWYMEESYCARIVYRILEHGNPIASSEFQMVKEYMDRAATMTIEEGERPEEDGMCYQLKLWNHWQEMKVAA